MTGLDLRAVVEEVLADSDAATSRELAELVVAQLPVEVLREALMVTLPGYVTEVMRKHRFGEKLTVPPVLTGSVPPRASKSWKVQAIRDEWQRKLDTRWNVGADGWKKLSECTRDDLLYAANHRRAAAQQCVATAETLERLIELMAKHKATMVGSLPTRALVSTLEVMAA